MALCILFYNFHAHLVLLPIDNLRGWNQGIHCRLVYHSDKIQVPDQQVLLKLYQFGLKVYIILLTNIINSYANYHSSIYRSIIQRAKWLSGCWWGQEKLINFYQIFQGYTPIDSIKTYTTVWKKYMLVSFSHHFTLQFLYLKLWICRIKRLRQSSL